MSWSLQLGSARLWQVPRMQSFDKHGKCMLLRAANGTDLLNTGNNTVESINTICTPPPPTYSDNDTYAELRNFWPCGSGPCINSTQEKGKVYFVDQTGNVQAQMQQVFNDIAATPEAQTNPLKPLNTTHHGAMLPWWAG